MQYFKLLFSVLMMSTGLSLAAQNTIHYTVEVGSFVNPKPADFDQHRAIGFVYTVPVGNTTAVRMGGYLKQEDAEIKASKIRNTTGDFAKVIPIDISKGKMLPVIQIGTERASEAFSWTPYLSVGKLYFTVENGQVKITTAPYPSMEAARADLANIRISGFPGAFPKTVNDQLIHKLGQFEMGGIKKPLIPLNFDRPHPDQVTAKGGSIQKQKTTTAPVSEKKITKEEATAVPVEEVTTTSAPEPTEPEVYELVDTIVTVDPNPVVVPVEKEKTPEVAPEPKPIPPAETAKTIIPPAAKDVVTTKKITTTSTPTAKKNTTKSAKTTTAAPKATATTAAVAIPSIRGDVKRNSAYVLQTVMKLNNYYKGSLDGFYGPSTKAGYEMAKSNNRLLQRYDKIPKCMNETTEPVGGFEAWESVRLLQAIAKDVGAKKNADKEIFLKNKKALNRLFLTPTKVESYKAKKLDEWHKKLWVGLDGWALQDPVLEEMEIALKVAYFQSYVLLEDYFMNKGFSASEAKALALQSLQSLVGYQLDRFV